MPNPTKLLALLGAAALVAGVSGCQKYEQREGAEHARVDTAAIAEAIKADEKKWSDEFQAKPKNLDALVAHYADDAYFVAGGIKPANGIAEIRSAYAEGLKDPNFNFTFAADKVEVAQSGDLAVARGRFTESYTDPETDKAKSGDGSFITVYKKQADGSWKVIDDFAMVDGG
jgi:ketosteroid isomerase-like protein